MLTIHFSQCTYVPLGLPEPSRYISYIKKGEYYEKYLTERATSKYDEQINTYDELCLIVAQYLVRTQKLPIQFVSHCNCNGDNAKLLIELDSEGDMIEDMHHGFFNQRLKYLR